MLIKNLRVRKLLGSLLILFLLILYAFAAMLVAVGLLPGANGWVQFAYYAIAGLAWVLPAGLIINWIYRKG